MIIYLESLGCARNQVDSEVMLGSLMAAGHKKTDDPSKAQVIVVNTCGFISTASKEAVEVILEMALQKEQGRCERLIVTGCLAQRYKDDKDLVKSLPEVDAFLGTGACDDIVNAVENKSLSIFTNFADPNKRKFADLNIQRELISENFAYLKVSEGCNRKCTYCIIPTLRGLQRSRPVDEVCKEASILALKGTKEIILAAENSTDYGQDLDKEIDFSYLLSNLAPGLGKESDNDTWIRVLYTHPSSLTEGIIKVISEHDNICSYYDVPIQHASSKILRRMGRPYTREELEILFTTIRQIDQKAVLRTTLIVGFPGESEKDFNNLVEFIEKVKFDYLGVFTYSDSDDLKSHNLKDHVPEEIAQKRHDIIMAKQAKISEKINEKHFDKEYQVLVEENPEAGLYIGRTMFQAPEVDGVTFIYASGLEIGTFVNVKITECFEYDIAGVVA